MVVIDGENGILVIFSHPKTTSPHRKMASRVVINRRRREVLRVCRCDGSLSAYDHSLAHCRTHRSDSNRAGNGRNEI